MFDWQTSKIQPAEQDLVKVLNSRYSFRLNLDRKVIEHVCTTSETFPGDDNSENKKLKVSNNDYVLSEEEEKQLLMDLDNDKSKLD